MKYCRWPPRNSCDGTCRSVVKIWWSLFSGLEYWTNMFLVVTHVVVSLIGKGLKKLVAHPINGEYIRAVKLSKHN